MAIPICIRDGLPMANKRPVYQKTFIRQWREARDMTQEDLAEAIEISVPQLSLIENGKRPYTQKTLEGAAKALKVDPATLLSRGPDEDESLVSAIGRLGPGDQKRALAVVDALKRSGNG